jgi:hypothetical protein
MKTVITGVGGITIVADLVGPNDPYDSVGQAQSLQDFFDSGFNVAPTAVSPAGGPLKIAVGADKNVHFVNPC